MQHYNATVQQQVGDHWGLEAGYVGSRGQHLPIFMEVNPTIPILTPTPRIGPRLFPAFSLVRPTFSVADVVVRLAAGQRTMRPWHGLNMLASLHAGPRGGSRVGSEHRRRVAADAAGHDRRPGVDRRRRWRARRATRCSTCATASSSASATSCRRSAIAAPPRGSRSAAGR